MFINSHQNNMRSDTDGHHTQDEECSEEKIERLFLS